MRWTVFSCLVACGLLLAGCDSGSGGGPVANAGGAMPPGPPGGPPSGPPPSDPPPQAGGAQEGTPPQQPGEGLPNPGTGDAGPAGGTPDSPPPPGGQPSPGDPGNPNAGDNPNPGDPGGENPDGTPRRPPPPRTLREQANAQFRAGNDVVGFKLLNAHFAVVPSAKEELAQKMAWFPGLVRPALAPRVGIAVYYAKTPLNFKGSPMPIGSQALTQAVDQMQQAEAADNRIGGTRRMSKYSRGARGPMANFSENSKGDPMANASAETQLNYYLGDIGEWFLEAFEEHAEAGEYGRVLQELTQQAARPLRRSGPGGAGGPGSDGQPGFPPGGFAGGEAPGIYGPGGEGGAPGGFDGPPAGPGRGGRGGRGGQFGGRGGGGQFAGGAGNSGAALDGLPGEEASGIATVRRWSTKAADKLRASIGQVRQLAPCIVWLGKVEEDQREELDKRAEAADLDVMAVFEMTIGAARTGNFINNTTKLRLLVLNKDGKWVPLPGFSAEPLINLTVERWRQKDEKGVDPVEHEITKAIDALNKALKPAPLPDGLTAERAKKRIADLVAKKPEEPLPVMVEARFYVSKGLLSEQDYTDAARELIGDTGLAKLKARAKEAD